MINFIKNFLKKPKYKWVEIYSPINGKIIDLSEVPDPALAQKMFGDGCAIEPLEGEIYCPIDAEVTFSGNGIFYSLDFFISFETEEGLELVFQLGLDALAVIKVTNLSKREGFYKKGDKLYEYDIKELKEKALSTKSPFIISNMEIVKNIEIVKKDKIKAGELIMKVQILDQ